MQHLYSKRNSQKKITLFPTFITFHRHCKKTKFDGKRYEQKRHKVLTTKSIFENRWDRGQNFYNIGTIDEKK